MKRKVGKEDQVVRQTRNSKYYESLETPPIKRTVGRPKKSMSANENKSLSVKRRGRPMKDNDEEKNQTVGSKGKKNKDSSKSKKTNENNRNCKIRTRTTPTALFNAIAILNDDRKKCLHEMGFASMIGMGIYELPGKLGYYVIDNFDSETNVLSLNDSSILVTLESVNDILGIPMGGCSIESLEPRTADDPFIKEWNEDAEDANVANPSEAANVAQASPTEQVSRAAILHASPIRMTKKATKRTERVSPAVGNSGGILCVWEKSAFKKNNSTISDYFVMIGGSWLCSGVNLLIISVYAPQEYTEKKMLWDYLIHVISKWDGE
nr:RNA-directed DNA polymerase, eukaryota, reverse transcriptase zinc-binding domain protein [Tanacetum cinerariifolium]